MVRIAVAGIAGRMGNAISRAVKFNEDAELAGGLEAPGHPAIGKTIAETSGVGGAEGVVADNLAEAMAKADVLIDFTSPAVSLANAKWCAENGKKIVIGTTGLDLSQDDTLVKLGQSTPIVFAPNMSVGMNLMFKLVGMIADVLGPDYALELIEAHHDQKKDAPSGSAVRLLKEMCAARGWDYDKVCAHGRCGLTGARPKEQIGVGVIRGGDIVGDHTVFYIGQGERIEITHRAHSRDTFAGGAVRAALWLVDKPAGLYDMQDVLGLKK